ncbi:uncharacterized protein LOC134833472 [Culicoides brevitarsis]|uniref:uncharacterized protein LOC134833472 n=1 Tax=Culicoides brevitarsis TaxID=469753 RepID=UPI00307B45F7
MLSTTRLCKLLIACVLLAKLSAAVPKKYETQSDGESTTTTDIASTVTDYQKETKNNATLPCMSNCGEWRVLQYPEFIHTNYHESQSNERSRQNTPYSSSSYNKNQTNDYFRRQSDTQDNHFSADDRYLNDINHHTIQFPPNQAHASFVSSTYPDNPWRRSFQKDKFNETNAAYSDNASDRTQRLGYSTGLGAGYGTAGYGGVSNGYGYSGAGIGPYGGYGKVDLGGVVLGAIIGVGALLIIPKFIAAFHGGAYGGTGYGSYRNIDEFGGVTDMMSKFDEFLAKNNVDSTACVQKAVCHYIRNSSANANQGASNQFEEMALSLADNSIVDYMIDGTAIKEALTNGRNGDGRDCDAIYSNCPLDRDSAIGLLKKFLPFQTK